MKRKVLLIAGFYKNDAPGGLGIQLDDAAAAAISNNQHDLDWFASAITARVAELVQQKFSHTAARSQLARVIAMHHDPKQDITSTNVIIFLSLVQLMEQRGWLQADDTNGMVYQTELVLK